MFKNSIKIYWRNLLNHRSYAIVNILGLSIGIASCIIIFLYVYNELTYDQYNLKANRIARITTTMHASEGDFIVATSPAPLADFLIKDFPEVETCARLEHSPQIILINNDAIQEKNIYKADQNVFSVFSFDFLEGNTAGALLNPQSIVIAKSVALKYFGSSPALGKTMRCNGGDLIVSGVIDDRPPNSDMRIDGLVYGGFSKITSWLDDLEVFTFILFKAKPNLKEFEQKVQVISKKYVQPELDAAKANYNARFELEQMKDVHFSKNKLSDTSKGDRQFDYIFTMLAIFILLIAILNYINLSTAKSTDRAKEVGIRKVAGALPYQLIIQFLIESLFLTMLSSILAILFVWISLPYFNRLLDGKLTFSGVGHIIFMLVFFLFTCLLGGLYPAFVLSKFKPIYVLKGNFRSSLKGVFLRKFITVIQFCIAAILILATVVIYRQMKFIQNKDLGYNKNQLLVIYPPDDSTSQSSLVSFQNELRERPEIIGITVGTPLAEAKMAKAPAKIEVNGRTKEFPCNFSQVDAQFIPVFQIRLLEGRNFSESFGTDKTEAFIVNEAFVKMAGWQSGLGHYMEGFDRKGGIIGVAKNFYYKSLKNSIEPMAFVYNRNRSINITTLRINNGSLANVRQIYRAHFPSNVFDYIFVDNMINLFYHQERVGLALFNIFTFLAIIISCLGLYGLVAIIMAQRSKEISIRKVIGASTGNLFFFMVKDFFKLIFWGVVIALPIAGFLMRNWLDDFAYHIDLSWWLFLIPVVIIIFITFLVISREIFNTAVSSPIKKLRSE
jgi:putative ABC transport system permease protein